MKINVIVTTAEAPMAEAIAGPTRGWARAVMAAEKVKERLRRATAALDAAAVPYAVIGGNAVAEWVARVDEDAVRNTKDVDLLVRRGDLPAVQAALEAVGFLYHHVWGVDTFIDGPDGKPSGGVHLLFEGERVRPNDQHELPTLADSERGSEFQVENRRTSQLTPTALGVVTVHVISKSDMSMPCTESLELRILNCL